MKLKLIEIFNAQNAFQKIFNEPLEVKLSYRLSKIQKKISAEMQEIDKQRIKLIEKYADEQTEEEKQKRTSLKVMKNLKEFVKEFNDLLEVETEIEIQLIPFKCIENIKLSVNDLNLLEKFIEIENEEEADEKSKRSP